MHSSAWKALANEWYGQTLSQSLPPDLNTMPTSLTGTTATLAWLMASARRRQEVDLRRNGCDGLYAVVDMVGERQVDQRRAFVNVFP